MFKQRKNKYNVGSRAEREDKDGIVHHSIRERKRWGELQLLERSGVIRELQRQVRFSLTVNDVFIADYIADFVYHENDERVVEDSKGTRTEVYRLKALLMKAIHGITIRET